MTTETKDWRNMPGIAPKGRHGTYSDAAVAHLRQDKRRAEDRVAELRNRAARLEVAASLAVSYIDTGLVEEARELLADLLEELP